MAGARKAKKKAKAKRKPAAESNEKTTPESPVDSPDQSKDGTAAEKQAEPKASYDLFEPGKLIEIIRDEKDDEVVKKSIGDHLTKLIEKHGLSDYRIVLLYDDYYSITNFHANKIYEAISDLNKQSDILMILLSDGGKVEPAYLISKACKRLCKDKFVVAIPRKAKSAATLIALGADELHMGLLSELGPIDPQLGGFPALGLSYAVEKIADLSCRYPAASDMFAAYLNKNLNIQNLGYYERVTESAAQYAERLLAGRTFPNDRSAKDLASHFTTHYKDHNFVIDADETARLLGEHAIKEGSAEYLLSNEIYSFLEFADFLFSIFPKKVMRYVGSVADGLNLKDKKKSS